MKVDISATVKANTIYNNEYASSNVELPSFRRSGGRQDIEVISKNDFMLALRERNYMDKIARHDSELSPYIQSGIPTLSQFKRLVVALEEFGFDLTKSQYRFDGEFVIFKGHAGLRKFLDAPRYKAINEKVTYLQIGELGRKKVLTTYSLLSVSVMSYSAYDHFKKGEYLEIFSGLIYDSASGVISTQLARVAAAKIAAKGLGVIAAGTVAAPIAAGIFVTFAVGAAFSSSTELQKSFDEAVKSVAMKLASEFKELSNEVDRELTLLDQLYDYLQTPQGIHWLQQYLSN